MARKRCCIQGKFCVSVFPHQSYCHQTSRRFVLVCAALVLAVGWMWPGAAAGAGFALVQQGTAAMAQGNAFVAEANDPSAIYYNPAGLNQLEKPQVYMCTVFNYPHREYQGDLGDTAKTRHRFYEAGTFYLAVPVHQRVVLGFGYFTPFGLGTDWPAEWPGRYITTYSRLKTYNLNPVISVKVFKNLAVAGGVNFLWSDVRLRRKIPLIPRLGIDVKSDLSGSGFGVGGNLGVLYEPFKGVKFGLAYRSPISISHSGRLDLAVPAFVPNATRSVGGSATLVYPPSLTFGVSVSRLKHLTVNFDATWTGWSTYKELKVNLDWPIPVSGKLSKTIVTEKNWHDAWALRFGANYRLTERMKIRAGYIFDMTPVPSATFEPQIPDSNRHILTIGGDTKIGRLTLGIAYNLILNTPRSKANRYAVNGLPLPDELQVNGKYRSHTHSLGLSSTFEF
ncbi:MAG: OmpP1/FadL family transporter [Desulfobaccales bacterium]